MYTCIGNRGPLAETIDDAIVKNDLVCAAVSCRGNRNFEARILPTFARTSSRLRRCGCVCDAGTMLKDLMSEPLGTGKDGKPVWIGDVWPSSKEVAQA